VRLLVNILVTTLGTSWPVVPELIGFLDPDRLPLYRHHPRADEFEACRRQYNLSPMDEIRVVTTDSPQTGGALEALLQWTKLVDLPVKVFRYRGVAELGDAEECRCMRDLIFRTVLHASEAAQKGQLVISLAGGRKTMSADMQDAAGIFGCHALLHVVDHGIPEELRQPPPEPMAGALPAHLIERISPIIISGAREPSPILIADPPITGSRYPLDDAPPPADPPSLSTDLADEIEGRMARAQDLLANFYLQHSRDEPSGNFHALNMLPPRLLNVLREYHFGTDPEREPVERAWLQALPKAELHCHFGGIASPAEIIEIARACSPDPAPYRERLETWLEQRRPYVRAGNMRGLRTALERASEAPKKNRPFQCLRTPIDGIPEPLPVVAFLLLFDEHTDGVQLLEQLVYGDLRDASKFVAVGIESYESLGDLQGSGILQSEAAIRTACTVLRRRCIQHNIRLCEVRCSPLNYTRGGLEARRVVEILLDALPDGEHTVFRLLFIASRHRRMSEIYRHIELIQELDANQPSGFRQRFVAMDLAGVEGGRTPEELRQAFLPLMRECRNLTIHAGETEPAESIWQAVYHLNADRIGHGLSLRRSPELMTRFINRRIAVEMCPSSNLQIVGFHDRGLPKPPISPLSTRRIPPTRTLRHRQHRQPRHLPNQPH